MDINLFKQLTVSERLQAMELLWTTLLHENAEIDSPDWHGDILAERKKKIESGKAHFISLDKLRTYRSQ